ncbi:biotin transporter BioY [Paenibacillus sp. 1P07SE]|uniref:biotin transporter BioY n=1 Tax=Paenibacillus sp. 1P07SE TaxID=3132209 RepID=UPI0039A5A87F
MSTSVRHLVFTALFAALFIVMSTLTIYVTAVPITLQNLAIMLAGGFLGARYGFYSIGIVMALTAAGLPLLHGQGGLSFILGPTGGFLWMFPVCALLCGFFVSRILDQADNISRAATVGWLFAVCMLFGSLISYVTGVPWLAHFANLSLERALAVGMYPFLPGDAVKALIAALVLYAGRSHRPMLHRQVEQPAHQV